MSWWAWIIIVVVCLAALFLRAAAIAARIDREVNDIYENEYRTGGEYHD